MQIKFQFTLEQVNQLLTLLGSLPYMQAAPFIQEIHNQAVPQIKEQGNGGEVDTKSNQEAGSPA